MSSVESSIWVTRGSTTNMKRVARHVTRYTAMTKATGSEVRTLGNLQASLMVLTELQ